MLDAVQDCFRQRTVITTQLIIPAIGIILREMCIRDSILACSFATLSGSPAGGEFARKNIDIGGLLVTIHRIVNDKKFIAEIKQEFLAKEWYDHAIGN